MRPLALHEDEYLLLGGPRGRLDLREGSTLTVYRPVRTPRVATRRGRRPRWEGARVVVSDGGPFLEVPYDGDEAGVARVTCPYGYPPTLPIGRDPPLRLLSRAPPRRWDSEAVQGFVRARFGFLERADVRVAVKSVRLLAPGPSTPRLDARFGPWTWAVTLRFSQDEAW